MIKKEELLEIKDLEARGWGSRLTIFRRIDRGELPEPFTFGKAHNSKKYWNKAEIDKLELELGINSFFFVDKENTNSLKTYEEVEEVKEESQSDLMALIAENAKLKAKLEAIRVLTAK